MPTSKPYSIYAGGYSEAKKAQLQATKVPDKLKCKDCKKLKPKDGFSERQLNDFKQRLARNPALAAPTSAIIMCRQCTPAQNHEMECSSCGLVKSLEGFTKAQRRHPDDARCIKCVNKDLKASTAGNVDPDNDESEEEDSDSDAVTNPYAETTSNAGTTSNASTTLDYAVRNLNIEDSDSDYNPYAGKASEKPQAITASVVSAKTGSNIPASTSSVVSAKTGSTIAPRSNFAHVKSGNVRKNPGGQIHETDAAKAAVGRQIYREDDSSDSEYGYM